MKLYLSILAISTLLGIQIFNVQDTKSLSTSKLLDSNDTEKLALVIDKIDQSFADLAKDQHMKYGIPQQLFKGIALIQHIKEPQTENKQILFSQLSLRHTHQVQNLTLDAFSIDLVKALKSYPVENLTRRDWSVLGASVLKKWIDSENLYLATLFFDNEQEEALAIL